MQDARSALSCRQLFCALTVLLSWQHASVAQSPADSSGVTVYPVTTFVVPTVTDTSSLPPGPVTDAVQSNAPAQTIDIVELQRRIERLEAAQRQNVAPSVTLTPSKDVAKKPLENSSNEVPSDKWNVRLGGHVQMDYVTWPDSDPNIVDPAEGNYFAFRRLRLLADGAGYDVFDFRLQMTLEPGQGANTNATASPDVKDAYISMNEIPVLGRMRVGNFFVPFGLEQVTNDTNNIFLERSIPTQGVFTPDREVGLAFYNCTPDENATLSTGVFFDDLSDTFKARADSNQGYHLSARGTWLPYYDTASDGRYLIHTGIGFMHTNDYDDRVRFRARPQVQRGPFLIDSGDVLADTYNTGNLELAIVCGRCTLQSEAFLTNINQISGQDTLACGAYSHLSYFLTGENRIYDRFGQHGAQFGRNKPFSNFSLKPGKASLGAWEAKVRWSYLDLTEVRSGQYNDVSAGLNWYWSDRTRWMMDWIHPWTDGQTTFGSTESDLLGIRLDFNW